MKNHRVLQLKSIQQVGQEEGQVLVSPTLNRRVLPRAADGEINTCSNVFPCPALPEPRLQDQCMSGPKTSSYYG